ncbi:MAG: hypothetical protein IPP69_06460 [Flavobacteriales bacterium]|nr:hypothetical protein [Flavobacteriales bacterium]
MMKNISATLAILLCISVTAFSQKKDANSDHYLIKGSIYQIDMFNEGEIKASNVQVVVYQEKELFVAFFTDELGNYQFYLPSGHIYEVWYGGSAFVNKKVWIDATQFPIEKKPRTIPLDIGLFRQVEGFDFPILNEPFVRIGYNPELDQIAPDLEYTEKREMELNKYTTKVKKEVAKRNKKKK